MNDVARGRVVAIRVVLPAQLRTLAGIHGEITLEVESEVEGPDEGVAVDEGADKAVDEGAGELDASRRVRPAVTVSRVLDALETAYPVLRGTVRDHGTGKRRPFVRFFACEEDLSHDPPGTPLPDQVVRGTEPFIVLGAIAGG